MAAASVGDNKAQNRFELDVEGAVAFANYRLAPGAVIITHTETPRALRGRGIASELVQGALKLIRADRLKTGRPHNPPSSPRKRGPCHSTRSANSGCLRR